MSSDERPSGSQSIPARIGRYRIVARVGRGGMGVVYSGVDESLGRTVALKVLIADLESDEETRARFYREAQAAASLRHPNIITVYDAGDDQGRSYIAMELLHGAPLAAYLKRPEAAPLERKLDLMIQLCEGLAVAHAEGIVHRDLKPSNLHVETDGLLKILDFGVARLADSSMTAAGTMLGTPDYMSPEQARGTQVDTRSDIFSAGAVFYYLLSGRKPFPGPDLPAVFHQLQHEDPEPLTGVPPALAAVVAHAMAKNPADRPARVEQLLASLVRFRREYQSETRRIASAVRARFGEIEQLVESLEATGAELRLADSAPASALQRLRDAFPAFGNRATTVDPGSSEQVTIRGVAQAVDGERNQLAALLDARKAAVAAVHAGEQALSSGDAARALQAFEQALSTCPGAARVHDLAESARAAAAAEARVRQRTNTEIQHARSLFRRGRYEEAIRQLRTFVESEPAARDAISELRRLHAMHAAIAEAFDAARARVQELIASASALASAGRLDDAVNTAREALVADPTDGAVATFLDELLRRQLETRLAGEHTRAREQRWRDCGPLLTTAREALRRGYVLIALQAAQSAQAIAPDHPEISAIIGRAQQELAQSDDQAFPLTSLPWPERGPDRAGQPPDDTE
jgi:tetratricopeptide (TPR) repeat protein